MSIDRTAGAAFVAQNCILSVSGKMLTCCANSRSAAFTPLQRFSSSASGISRGLRLDTLKRAKAPRAGNGALRKRAQTPLLWMRPPPRLGVSRICNPQRARTGRRPVECNSAIRQIANLRYGGSAGMRRLIHLTRLSCLSLTGTNENTAHRRLDGHFLRSPDCRRRRHQGDPPSRRAGWGGQNHSSR